MSTDGFLSQLPDIDRDETAEWLESLDAVAQADGKTRARYLLGRLNQYGRELQLGNAESVSTDYVNTIPTEQQPFFPGDETLERRIRAYIRWNAAAMVIRGQQRADGIGGHLSTFASSASLYEVGFNWFFRGKEDGTPGDRRLLPGPRRPRHLRPGLPRGSSRRASSTTSASKSTAAASPATPTPGSCPTSGSTRRSRWASVRSTRSTMLGS